MTTLQVPMKLEGHDGNAFAILGTFIREAKRAGYTEQEYQPVIVEATSGDYIHLLQTLIANTDTKPLDDRDTTPWDEADGEIITEDEDAEAYQKEREDERLDAHFAPSDGNVY